MMRFFFIISWKWNRLLLLGMLLCILSCIISSCNNNIINSNRISAKKQLVFLTTNNLQCYYKYDGKEMGFEYELARSFADQLGVDLVVHVVSNSQELSSLIKKGIGDIISASLYPSNDQHPSIVSSKPYITTDQMLVVNRSSKITTSATLSNHQLDQFMDRYIDEVVKQNSAAEQTLLQLTQAIPEIKPALLKHIETKDIPSFISKGTIDATALGSNPYRLYLRYLPELSTPLTIAAGRPLCWGVKKQDKQLLKNINFFFSDMKRTKAIDKINYKYFGYADPLNRFETLHFETTLEEELPQYEALIKQEAMVNGFDWRLIVAQIYQESHFNSRAKSPKCAQGIMQFTQQTAKEMGINNVWDPYCSIPAGVKYLKRLYDTFNDRDEFDRLCLALAAYNLGKGHVIDAIKTAKKYGLNPKNWVEVEKAIWLLNNSEVSTDMNYGYCNWQEGIEYVRSVLNYYDLLRRKHINCSVKESKFLTDINAELEAKDWIGNS
ncbi:MAG: transglycosylase SLT domain-containing protein [Pseudomonadota bacterium]